MITSETTGERRSAEPGALRVDRGGRDHQQLKPRAAATGALETFARSSRTDRSRCGAQPAVCAHCVEILEVGSDEARCRSCGSAWPIDDVARVPVEDGLEDGFCASHAAVWRRLTDFAAVAGAEDRP